MIKHEHEKLENAAFGVTVQSFKVPGGYLYVSTRSEAIHSVFVPYEPPVITNGTTASDLIISTISYEGLK